MFYICFAMLLVLPDENLQTQQWLDYYDSEANKIEVWTSDRQQQLTRSDHSLLNWKNEIRFGQTNGSLYVWLRDSRVAVVGTIFSHADRNRPTSRIIARSMLRLCEEEVVGEADKKAFWTPSKTGMLRGQKLAEIKVPESSAARLTQMRKIADRFSALIVERDGTERQLRLLRTPIYRQDQTPDPPSANPATIDGGLFALVTEGTDPEALLLIEAIQTAEENHWEYSIGRFTVVSVRVSLDGEEIWAPARNTAGSNYDTDRFTRRELSIENQSE